MNPNTELFRNAILRQLAAASPASLTPETLTLGIHTLGFNPSAQELAAQLLYLTQRNFIEPAIKEIAPATTRYRIAAAGLDYLQKENLI